MPESAIREFADTTADPAVRGFLHVPVTLDRGGLVLTHSAGGNAEGPLLRALADMFAANAFTVLRCNLPFRQARSFGPPGPGDAARDRGGLKNAVEAMKEILKKGVKEEVGSPLLADFARSGDSSGQISEKIFLAGHSYGGRQASMLCAEEPDLVAGLLLLSYPLHPPRRPEQQRTQHLPDLRTPTLFVHGTRDPFGTVEELQRAIKMIPAKTRLLAMEGAGHDVGFKGRARQEGLPRKIYSEFATFLGLSS